MCDVTKITRTMIKRALKALLKFVNGDFKHHIAVIVFGHVTCAHIYLQGRNNQTRHGQRRVALGPELYKIFARFACTHVDIMGLLFSHGRFPCNFTSIWRIVMAHDKRISSGNVNNF